MALVPFVEEQDDGRTLVPYVETKQNKGILGDIGTGLKRGVEQLPGTVTGLADIAAAPVSAATGINRPFSRAADWLGEKTGFQPEKWAEQAGAEYSPEMQQSLKNVEEAKGFFPTLGAIAQNPRVAANLVAESLPSTIAGGLLARGAMGAVAGAEKLAAMKAAGDTAGLLKAGAIAGGIGEGAITAGQQMAQTDYGVDPLRAAGAAAAAGAITGAIGAGSGRLANSAIGQKLGLSDIETSIAAGTLGKNAGKGGAIGYAKRIGAGALQEGLLEEAPQSYSEQVWQNLANGKPWNEGAAEAAAQGAIAGGLMGGGINAIPRFNNKQEEQAQVPPANPNVVEVPTQTGETVPVDKTSGPISAAVHAGAQSGAIPTAQPVVDTTADPFERLATLELLAEQRPLTPQENAEASAISAQLSAEDTNNQEEVPSTSGNPAFPASPATNLDRMLQNKPEAELQNIAGNENADVRVRQAAINVLNRQPTAPAQPTTKSPLVQKATQPNIRAMPVQKVAPQAENIPTNPVANVQGSVSSTERGEEGSALWQATKNQFGRDAVAAVAKDDPHYDEKINLIAIAGMEGRQAIGINPNTMRSPALAETGWTVPIISGNEDIQPSNAAPQQDLKANKDNDLAGLYRDWIAKDDYRVTAYPSDEQMASFAKEAKNILAGKGQLTSKEDFERYARLRAYGNKYGFGLSATNTAFDNGQDVDANGNLKITGGIAQQQEGVKQQSEGGKQGGNSRVAQDMQNRDRGRTASVLQMQKIAQNPDYEQASISQDSNGAPMVANNGSVPSGAVGKKERVTLPDGTKIDTNYAVVEADSLSPSHFADGRENAGYGNDGKLTALNNGRTAGLMQAYTIGTAENYRVALEHDTDGHGIPREVIVGMNSPVLVRIYDPSSVDQTNLGARSNQASALGLGTSEQASTDASMMDSMDGLNPDDSGDFTTSRDFIRRFMSRLPQTEQAGMVDADGSLSQSGYSRIRNAILAKAYGNSPVLLRMVESLDDNMRNVTKALVKVAPKVAKSRAAIADGALFNVDITSDILAAVEELSTLKESGRSINDALAQQSMFGGYSDEVRSILQFIGDNLRKPNRIADFISAGFDALEAAGNPNQGSIFGESQAPTKGELLNTANRKINGQEAVGKHAGNQEAGGQSGTKPGNAPSVAQGNAAGNEERPQDGFNLAAQTPAEIAAIEAAKKAAVAEEKRLHDLEVAKVRRESNAKEMARRKAQVLAEREAAKKAEVDAAAANFDLGQAAPAPVERRVDTEAARGQQDVFAQKHEDQAHEDNHIVRAMKHTKEFVKGFAENSRELKAQQAFVAAAEKKFGIGKIAGYKGGLTVHVADRNDGNATVYMQSPSGNFAEAGTIPLEQTAVYANPSAEPKQSEIAAAREEYNKSKSALDAIGKEPPKPRPESKAFGSNGRAKADPAVVQAYDAETKRYNSWRIKYLRLKKAEVEASNKLFRLTTEEKRAQNQQAEPKQDRGEAGAALTKEQPEKQSIAQQQDAVIEPVLANAQKSQGDLGTEKFTISIPMFGDMPHRAVSGVKLPDGYTLVSSRVIVKKVSITNRDQKDYDLPPTIYAWRVSAIENKNGEPFAHIEAMTSDYGRNENGETNAYFTEVRGHARDALDRIAPSIANAAKRAFEAARDSKMVGDLLEESPEQKQEQPAIQKEEAKPAAIADQQIVLKKGDRFKDGSGKTWEIWSARTGLVEAFPVIDDKIRVNNQDGVRFATDERSRFANPEARTDVFPIAKPATKNVDIEPGLRGVAERQVAAQNKFVDSVMEQFGLSKGDADKAWDYFVKNKLVKVDAVGGQYTLTDGRMWDEESMLRAANGGEPAAVDAKKEAKLPWQMTREEYIPSYAEITDEGNTRFPEEKLYEYGNPDKANITNVGGGYSVASAINRPDVLLLLKDDSTVGVYSGEFGIKQSHRGHGAATRLIKEAMRLGVYEPDLSYSVGGAKTVEKAHKELVSEALSEGKPVPAEVLADYPDLQKKEAKAEPAEASLIDAQLLREYRNKWQYKTSANGGWMTANTKQDAVDIATKAYLGTPENERLTRQQRNDKADSEEFAQMDSVYGKLSDAQLSAKLEQLGNEIKSNQAAGEKEFDGNGRRRTGAAVSNEAARVASEESMKLERYIARRNKSMESLYRDAKETDKGTVLYSMDKDAAQAPMPQPEAEQNIKRIFGDKLGKVLIDAGIVTFVQKASDLMNLPGAKLMTAWHGSPHDHDKFDSSKIGTGEGAQSYGYGLYFAGNKEVAEHYRKGLSQKDFIKKAREAYSEFDDPDSAADALMEDGELSDAQKELVAALREDEWLGFDYPHQAVMAAFREPENFNLSDRTKAAIAAQGKLYQVELAPKEDEYLDWDKPLSEQSEFVKDALRTALGGRGILKRPASRGENIYRDIAASIATGGGSYASDGQVKGAYKAASDYLHSIGIRGTRYLDGSSRSKGEGNYNYVIFSDDDVSITAKYAKQNSVIVGATFPDGSIALVLENLNASNFDGVLAHEGLHSTLKEYVGQETYSALMKELETKLKSGLQWAKDAKAQVPANTAAENVTEEVAAYSVERYISGAKQSNVLRRWVESFLSALRTGIIKHLPNGKIKMWAIGNLKPQDLTNLAIAGLKAKARGQLQAQGREAMAYSKINQADTPEFESDVPNEQWLSDNIDYAKSKPQLQESDIRYSVASTVSNQAQQAKSLFASLTSPESINTLIYNFQNKFIDLKNLQERIKKLGGTINDLNDAVLGEKTYHSKVMKEQKDFLAEEIRPLLQQMLFNKVSKESLESFLHARHAEEANRVLAERNPNRQMIIAGQQKAEADLKALQVQYSAAQAAGTATKAIEAAIQKAKAERAKWSGAQAFQGTEAERTSLSGMSDQEAKKVMAGFAGQRAIMDSLTAKVDAIQAKTLANLERSGLMDKASLDAWKKTYQYYVPLHRDEAHPDTVSHPVGQGFSVRGDASKRRTGSNEKVTNILGHIAMQREAAITRGEKNSVDKRLYLLAAQNPDKSFWTVGRPEMKKGIDPRTGFVYSYVDPTYKNKPNVLVLRIAGKDTAIIFNEHNPEAVRLAGALKNLDGQELDVVERTIGRATRWFAAVNTQYNPIFGMINFARDLQTGILNLTSTDLKDSKMSVFKEAARLFKEAAKAGFRLDQMNASDKALWNEFQKSGGATGYRDLFANPEERTKALEKELKALDRGEISKKAHAVAQWLSDYNESMENVVRMAAYKIAIKNGMSKERAAVLAKDLTVNFNQKGAKAAKLGAFYAFFNASIQGTARLAQTMKGPAGKKILMGGIALGVLQQILGSMFMGGGDDDEWEKIPDFVKERSLIFPVGDGKFVTIPMPLGFNVLPNIGRLFTEWAMGGNDKPTGKQLGKLMDVVIGSFNPLGGGGVVDTLSPTITDPVVSLLRNKDWTGKPIYREDMESLNPTPGFTRTKDSATPWAKGLSYLVNMASGGTDFQPGALSPTPDQIDYVIGQLTGGVGRETGKLAQTVAAPFTGDELPVHKIPLAGRLVGSTAGISGQSERFYENIRTLNGIEREVKGLAMTDGDVDGYIDSEPRANLIRLGNLAELQVKKLRESQRALRKIGDTSAASEIDNSVIEVMKNLNTEMRAANR